MKEDKERFFRLRVPAPPPGHTEGKLLGEPSPRWYESELEAKEALATRRRLLKKSGLGEVEVEIVFWDEVETEWSAAAVLNWAEPYRMQKLVWHALAVFRGLRAPAGLGAAKTPSRSPIRWIARRSDSPMAGIARQLPTPVDFGSVISIIPSFEMEQQ